MGPDLPYAGGKFPSFEGGAVLRSTLNLKMRGIKSNVRRSNSSFRVCGDRKAYCQVFNFIRFDNTGMMGLWS